MIRKVIIVPNVPGVLLGTEIEIEMLELQGNFNLAQNNLTVKEFI